MKCIHCRTNDVRYLKSCTNKPSRRKLLRSKSPDENSSGRSLWKVCSSSIFFAPPPPLQIKLGGPIAVNCSGIILFFYFTVTITSMFTSLTLGRPGGGGLMQPPLAFFPCNFFDDSNRKRSPQSYLLLGMGRHILAGM